MADKLLFAPAAPGRTVRLMTIISLAALILCAAATAIPMFFKPELWWIFVLEMGILGGVFVGCWAYVPVAYELSDEAVVIHRKRAQPVTIPLAALRDVRPTELPRWKTARLCGNGGLFMFAGLFSTKELGRFYMSVRDARRTVLLEGETIRSWVISPADVARFVEEATVRLSAEQ